MSGAAFVSRLLLSFIALALAAGIAQAETQTLTFDRPGWHFVSIGVIPDHPDPLSVFPTGNGFEYDHLWTFDPEGGWRYYSPDPATPATFIDLDEIKPLRGYWIHVTQALSTQIYVTGDRADMLQLDPPTPPTESWHAIGPLLAPGVDEANVQTVFAMLGAALPTSVLEVWRHDRSTDALVEVSDYAADCGASPEDCLAPGEAYWVETDGLVLLAPLIRLSSDGIVISGDDPFQRLRLRYDGVGPLQLRIQPEDADSGIQFLGASTIAFDDVLVPQIDASVDPDGPDSEADFDGDGSPEPCTDACEGEASCVSLCFASGGSEHVVYVGTDLATLTSEESFTTIQRFSPSDPGNAHTELLVTVPPGGSGSTFPLAPGQTVASVPVALKPAVLRGIYTGSLVYEDPDSGRTPFQIWLDDCVDLGGASVDCSTSRAVAILNPTVFGSVDNGFDDDGDGDVDEAAEDRAIATRRSPGFGPETVLRGEISSNKQGLRLAGETTSLDDLGFARETCLPAGACSESGTACVTDADCAGEDAGLALAFALTSSRTLDLEGVRTGPSQFVGVFTDRYTPVDLGGDEAVSSSGRFVLDRVQAPVCVVPRPVSDPTIDPVVLGVGCRADSDCPGRCVGDAQTEGAACFDSGDCGAGTCENFPCMFTALAPTSEAALDYTPVVVTVTGLDRDTVVRLDGAEQLSALATVGSGGSVDLGALHCGTYSISVEAPGCEDFTPSPASFDPCSGVPALGPLVCETAAVVPASTTPGAAGGGLALLGGPILLDAAPATGGSLEVESAAGEPAVLGPAPVSGSTHVLGWPSVPVVLRAGLMEAF